MDENSVQKTEIPPKEIFELMKTNIFDNFTHFSLLSINKDYINSRKTLFNLLHKITMKMGFKSQTFFLCSHFLDIIFTKKKRIHLNLNILGLSCLCLAAKYCENDPMVPHLQYFIKIFNSINGYKNAILMSELKKGEVTVLKILNYKLNYYTIYDFNSFLFGHGILKIEQLKDIENKNKKLYRSSRKKFVVNNTNSLMIKNILEKIYKKSRYYLDIIVKTTKICFKYNPLFISIYIMKKSVEEILANERKINTCEKKEKEEFYEKNNQCFKQIMYDFYKINYEENEQYKRILDDDEINEILGGKEKKDKNEGIDPAPLADRKIINDEDKDDNNTNTNRNLFINTYTNGFYNRIKLKENHNEIIKRNNNKPNIEKKETSESKSEESKEEDDLEMNLNINEIQRANDKKYNSKKNSALKSNKDKENKNKLIENKYTISTNNRDINSISNKKNYSSNYDLTYSVEPYRNKIYINNNAEKTSPIKYGTNTNGNLTGIKKYVKIKGINTGLDKERSNYPYNLNTNVDNNSSTNKKENYNYNTIKKFEKQPYFKKLINNDSNLNSINRNGVSSFCLTNTGVNKNDINYRNTIDTNTINTYNRIRAKDEKNKIIENNYQDNFDDVNKKETEMISTTSSRFRKMLYRNKKENNNKNMNISTEVKNAKDLIINDTSNKNENKREIESYTQFNWNINNNNKNDLSNKYRNNNIFIRKNKILNLKNNVDINEDKKNLTSRNFYKNIPKRINVNISNNNDNMSVSFQPSNNKYSNNINNNNEQEKKITVNTIENSNSQRVYQSIRHKYLNMKNNKINNEPKNNNTNAILEDKNNKTSNYFYKKNISNNNNNNINNINQNNNSIRAKYEQKNENKNVYKKFSEYSIYNIINKTKELFTKNNNAKEENKRINEKKIADLNNTMNNNNSIFYKSQQNFYQPKTKPEININNNNRKIVINNNININIGNKTNNINTDYNKYNNIYKRDNIQSNTKKNNINNNYNNNNIGNNNNNNKVNKGINFSNILNKFQFYRKAINKKNNNN